MTEYENMKGFSLRKMTVVRAKVFVPESVRIFGKAVEPHINESYFELDGLDIIEYTYTLVDGRTCGIAVTNDHDDELHIGSFIDNENVEENYLESESNSDEIELMIRRMVDRLVDKINEERNKE